MNNNCTNFIIFLILVLAVPHTVNAQNDIAVRIRVKVDADACGACNHDPIKTVNLCLKDSNRTKVAGIIYDGIGGNYYPYGYWRYKTVAIDSSENYVLRWYDPTGGGWQERDLTKDCYTTQKEDYHHSEGWISWHSVWMNAEIETYDRVTITDVQFTPCVSNICNGSTQCVDNIDGNLTFSLSVINANGPDGMYIQALDKNDNLIREYYCGNYNSTETIRFSSLNLQDHLGEDIYFRTRTDYGGGVPYIWLYKKSSFSKTFFKQIPAPTAAITSQRRACYPTVIISVPLASSVVSDIGSYKFRAIYGTGKDENTSNIIRLQQYDSINNNVVRLVPNSADVSLLNRPGNYTLQIFQSIQDLENTNKNNMVSFPKIQCAVTCPFTLLDRVQYPSFTVSPVSIDGTQYNTTRHDRSDGQLKLIINNIANTANQIWAYFGKAEPDPPDAWSGATVGTVNTWQNIELDGITGATTRKSEWTLNNFDGNARYFVYLSDGDGCNTSSTPVNLLKPDPITISVADNTKFVTCHANNADASSNIRNDGAISVIYSGGIPPYNILLDENTEISNHNATSATIYNRSEKVYTVQVSDKYGEISTGTNVSVESNPEMVLSAYPTDLTCFEGGNGSIQLSATNLGNGTSTYSLSGQIGSSTNYQNLSAGTYTATVINPLGCRAVVNNILVGQPNDIIINATGSKIARHGDNTGTIDLEITGGWTNSYNYELYRSGILIDSGSTAQNATIGNLIYGEIEHGNPYKIIAKDANACDDTLYNIQVIQPNEPLELSFSKQPQNVDCNGNATGEVYPTATGGWGHYQYGFNGTVHGTSNTIGGLTATGAIADTVFVIDSAGVIEKLPVTITEPPQIVSSIDNIYNLKCFEDNSGAVKLNISGGTKEYRIKTDYTDWVNGDSISSLPIMDIEPVYVLDAHDCPSQVDVTITQPDKIAIVVDTLIDAFCGQDNGVISTVISGGTEAYAFNWTYLDSLKSVPVNSNIIGGIYSGQYKLFLSDAHGCTDSLTVSVSDTDGPEILAYKIDTISCFGGSDGKLTIQQVDGGLPEYAYYLDGIEGDTTFERLENKTYHFRLLDKKGCKLDRYYIIPEPEDIAITGTVVNPVCHNSFDGFIATRIRGGNGGYVYRWSNNIKTKDLQNLNSGSYTLTVTDKKACEKSESFEVIPPLAPTAHLNQNVGVLCTGNSLELDGGDFISYQWYKDAVLVSQDRYLTVDQTGQYTLKISNQLGCIGVDTFDLEVSDTPLDATILLQDSAMVDEVVRAIDVTWPIPDSIQWYFDYPVELVEKNNYSQKFSSTNTGTINVTLRAWYGGCFSDSSKSVTIYYEEGGVPQKSAMYQPLILGYKAYPNPNDGDFHVGVELSRQADISLHLFNVGSGSAIDITRQYGLERYDVPFNLAELKPGVYVLVLVAEHEQQRLKVVIK